MDRSERGQQRGGPAGVVVGGDLFQTVPLRRPPELIALSSPRDATGLLELEPQPDLRLPFEGLGVATAWEFRLPRAANPFDFNTLADVLLTIDYTALDSDIYRRQVLSQLDDRITADRAFSFREQFPDRWYDLHNPEQAACPMVVTFSTRADDYPPNVEDLKIEQILLAFVRPADASFAIPPVSLRFAANPPDGEFTRTASTAVGGIAGPPVDGIISTRRGNAAAWAALLSKTPVGDWELTLPDTDEMRNRFHMRRSMTSCSS